EAGVELVTLWLLSTDNLRRDTREVEPLLHIIEDVVTELAVVGLWRINLVGAAHLLPEETVQILRAAVDQTASVEGMVVNVAIGYGGRQEIADAVRSLLAQAAEEGTPIEQLAQTLEVDDIAE